MKTLIDELKKARQATVKSEGITFTIRRPTDLEMLELQSTGKIEQRDILCKFVTDWGKVTEIVLGIPGGTGQPVVFSSELFSEWIADHPEHWGDLTTGIVDSYKKHEKEVIKKAKN